MDYRVDLAKARRPRPAPRPPPCRKSASPGTAGRPPPPWPCPPTRLWTPTQRNRIRTLGVSVAALGQILREQGSPDCVAAYEEAIRYYQRIGDTAAEAIAHYNLGHAYKDIPAIRDLDAAEAAYQRSLALHDPE